jgi:O-acetylserine/cysteine efflux transporter
MSTLTTTSTPVAPSDTVRSSRRAIIAIAAAGVLWGLNVPLTKLALGWLNPGWLTVARFVVAAPLLAFVGRRGLRDALTVPIILTGAVGFGWVVVLQNAGVAHTSVSHASIILGAIPVVVALIATATGHARIRALTWFGYGLMLLGLAAVASGPGGGASTGGDVLVLISSVISGATIVAQPRLLAGRDAAAVTAVQLASGALATLPIALMADANPLAGHASPGAVLAFVELATVGTVLPFWLFAHGQGRTSPQLAGAFVNLEPLVGVAVGWLAFGNHAGLVQLLGALSVLLGIVAAALPAGRPLRTLWQTLRSGGQRRANRSRSATTRAGARSVDVPAGPGAVHRRGAGAPAGAVSRIGAPRTRWAARRLPRRSRRLAGAKQRRARGRRLPDRAQRQPRRSLRDITRDRIGSARGTDRRR